MEQLAHDCRYALGRFIAQPVSTLIIVLTLALGIGATTAIFSVVNGLMWQATPFTDSDRLVWLRQQDLDNGQRQGFSASELGDYRQQLDGLDALAEYHNMTFTLYRDGDPQRVQAGVVSVSFFEMLSLEPVLGRLFLPGEDAMGAEPLMVLSYEFWQREFGGRMDIINTSVEMNNRTHTIIGVLPSFPQFPNVNDIYLTMPSCPWRSSEQALSNRNFRMMNGFGKLKAGVSLADFNRQLSTAAGRLSQSFPEAYPTAKGFDAAAVSLNDELIRANRPYLLTLLATTVLLLLIACANVTNLILSQHAKRQREFAVRASLGASRGRLIRQLLTESVMLALAAGALGLAMAYVGVGVLREFAAGFSARATAIRLDGTVMGFALLISLAAGLLAGLAPSFQRLALVTALKEGGKASVTTAHGGVRNSLLVGQFALSLTLLVVAGLALKSLHGLERLDPGYSPEGTQVVQLDLNWSIYQNGQQRWQFTRTLLDEVRQLPYVASAGVGMTYPLDQVMMNSGALRQPLRLDDRDYDPNWVLANAFIRPVSDGYLETLGARLQQGRLIERRDDAEAPRVAIINRALADVLWPNESAIDHRVSADNGASWITIVGVVENIRERGLSVAGDYQIYLPMAQAPRGHIAVLAKVDDQADFAADLKALVKGLDGRQPLSKVETLQQAMDNSLALQRMLAQLLGIFAMIAMTITLSGIGGVMGYLVSLRTREIGIRMAIGASPGSVLGLILGYGLKLILVGLSVGLAGAYGGGLLLAEHLYQLQAFDLPVYAGALVLLTVIALLACWLPARRASSIAPNLALRQ